MTPVLEFQDIARSYNKGVPVLNGVTFDMKAGEVVGLLGRNGAGKTTLIRIAMGMLFPHGGSVRVFGLSPTTAPVAVKKRVGYVAEDQVLPPGVSARVAVEEAATLGWSRYIGPKGKVIGMHSFGASAPLKDLQKHFGFTSDAVIAAAKEVLGKK